MTKTCGTCGNFALENGKKHYGACMLCGLKTGGRVDYVQQDYVFVGKNSFEEACGCWKPRTDSNDYDRLEDVLKEMLMCIARLTEYGSCRSEPDIYWPDCKHCGDMTPCYERFEQQLSSCGVKFK